MSDPAPGGPIEILVVEDSPDDIVLIVQALEDGKVPKHVTVIEDGTEALMFLRQEGRYAVAPRPDLILLNLYLPGMYGLEVLAVIKQDQNLKIIPVVILTSSREEKDIREAYACHANGYVIKPLDVEAFLEAIKSIEHFWLTVLRLPTTIRR